MGAYIHRVLVFDESFYSGSLCIQWVLIFMECLCSLGPYSQWVLGRDSNAVP